MTQIQAWISLSFPCIHRRIVILFLSNAISIAVTNSLMDGDFEEKRFLQLTTLSDRSINLRSPGQDPMQELTAYPQSREKRENMQPWCLHSSRALLAYTVQDPLPRGMVPSTGGWQSRHLPQTCPEANLIRQFSTEALFPQPQAVSQHKVFQIQTSWLSKCVAFSQKTGQGSKIPDCEHFRLSDCRHPTYTK